MEYVEIRPGSPLPQTNAGVPPGGWMLQDIKLQDENAERALGMSRTSLGQPPSNVSAYSAMALLTENDALKLDPIGQALRLEMVELGWDTFEAMKNWKKDKKLLLAGPKDELRVVLWDSQKIPNDYLVRQPRGGSLPRSQAAELQKVNDIWTASAGKLPLSWYITSLDAGRAQELPATAEDANAHKAELENVVMLQTGETLPVAEYDDHPKHIPSHTATMARIQPLADSGDEKAMSQVVALKTHISAHEAAAGMSAQENVGAEQAVQNPPMDSPQAGQSAIPPIPPVPPV